MSRLRCDERYTDSSAKQFIADTICALNNIWGDFKTSDFKTPEREVIMIPARTSKSAWSGLLRG